MLVQQIFKFSHGIVKIGESGSWFLNKQHSHGLFGHDNVKEVLGRIPCNVTSNSFVYKHI